MKKDHQDTQHIFMGSLVVGFVYCNIASIIPFSVSEYVDVVLMVLASLLLGYVFGRFSVSSYYPKVISLFKIRNLGNMGMWSYLTDQDYPMKSVIEINELVYSGMIHNIEEKSNPIYITLASYIIQRKDGYILEDHLNDSTSVIVLDASKATCIRIIYNKGSNKCIDLSDLCNANTED